MAEAFSQDIEARKSDDSEPKGRASGIEHFEQVLQSGWQTIRVVAYRCLLRRQGRQIVLNSHSSESQGFAKK
jgi:hypothetical protein